VHDEKTLAQALANVQLWHRTDGATTDGVWHIPENGSRNRC